MELDKFIFKTKIITEKQSNGIKSLAFQYNNFTIWGATAMILNEFKILLKSNIFTGFKD